MRDALHYADAVIADLANSLQALPPGEALRQAIATGVTEHVEIDVPPQHFAQHLLPRLGGRAEESLRLHFGDLYLACAALRKVRGAIERLQSQQLASVPLMLRSFPVKIVEEVTEGLLENLVFGKKPKLVQYGGRSRLRTWLKTVAIHRAQDLLRKHDALRGANALEAVAEVEEFVDALGVNAEKEYARHVSKVEFRRAVVEALSRLPAAKRSMLRGLHVDRLTLKELGAPEGVEPSTTFRRLQQIYQEVRRDIHRILEDRMKLSPAQCDSMMRLMFSQIDLRMSQLFPPAL